MMEANESRVYLGIDKDKLSITNDDLKPESPNSLKLKGGFSYGKNRVGSIYGLPRPLMNHGIHRCKSHSSSPVVNQEQY